MARTVTGVDVGLRTTQFLRGQVKGNTFHVTDFAVASARAKGVSEGWAAADPGFKLGACRVGLTGRDVNVRYTRVPRVPEWQLRNLMRFEVEEIGDTSGAGVASDFNLLPELPEIEGEDVVLLAMARESLLEEHADGLAAAGGKLEAFSPNAIALYNAWVRYGVLQDETVLVANVGHENLDVVIARGPDLLFARNLTGGSRLFEDAIAQRFGISEAKAEAVKIEQATLRQDAQHADPNAEKASRAILGAAGQLLSLLQSTVLFCKSQVKITGLKLDRVVLCGGGAAQDGLCEYLRSGMGVPVELFDPWRVVQTEGLSPEAAELLEEYKLEAVCALGLATMASDPEAYSVELLPADVKKRREFVGGTLFLIAAAVLALAFLGYDAWRTSRDLAESTGQARTLERRYQSASRTDASTRELVAENERLAELATRLQTVAGSGEQAARGLELLRRELPEEFWLTRLASEWRFDPELGVPRGAERPILSIEGRAREGTRSLATLYEGFVAALSEGLPGARVRAPFGHAESKFTVDLTHFAPPAPDAAGAPAEGAQ